MAKEKLLSVRDLVFHVYDSGAVDVQRNGVMVMHIQANDLGSMHLLITTAMEKAQQYDAAALKRAEGEIARIKKEAERQIAELLANVPK